MTFIAPIATNSLVENFGWRIAYATLGAVAAVVVVPVVYLFFSSAKDAKRKAAGNVGLGRHPSSGRGMSLAEGLKSPPYVKLAVAALVLAGISVALLVNLVPILTSLGRDRGEAAAIAGMVGLTAIAGRLSGGYLLDHFNARVVGAIAALVLATSCLLLLNFGATTAGAITAVLIAGLAVGAEIDVVAYLTSRIVGAKSFGGLFGIMEGMLMFGAGIGPIVSNAVYDATRSYDAVLWAIVPLGMLVAFLLFTLGRYPDFVKSADAAS
jgi:predicted MFS family arabinose efflux permease